MGRPFEPLPILPWLMKMVLPAVVTWLIEDIDRCDGHLLVDFGHGVIVVDVDEVSPC